MVWILPTGETLDKILEHALFYLLHRLEHFFLTLDAVAFGVDLKLFLLKPVCSSFPSDRGKEAEKSYHEALWSRE